MKATGIRSGAACSVVVTVLLAAIASAAFGQENGELTIGVKSRVDWWETSKEKYDHQAFGGGGFFDPTTIESKDADIGLLIGPELKYTYHNFFARGFSLWGSSGLSGGGDIDREYLGVDFGYAKGIGAFIGYRQFDASFAGLTGSEIADHSVSDAVLGLILQADQQKPGFKWGIEMVAGIQALFNSFDDDEYYRNPTILEAEVTFGYKFKDMPLTINVGYGIWSYGEVARTYPYSPSIVIDEIVERWEDWGHGITLSVTYSF